MKFLIGSTVLCAALLVGNISACAEETVDAASTPAAPSAPAAPAADEDKGVHIKIELDSDDDAEVGKDTLLAVDAEADADEDDGPVGKVVRKGVAEFLEEHVLTSEDMDEEDREEIREAIAELRGEVDGELQEAAKEIEKEVGATKKKRAVVINNPMGHTSADDDGFGIMQAMVAALAIIFSLGMPIIIVGIVLYFGYRKRRLAHDTINQYLASGKEIPPEVMQNLFKDAAVTATPRTNLHKGTINTSIGLGMVIGFNAIDADFLAAIGFIFLLVGLAQLLIWKLEQGKRNGGGSTQG